MGFSFRKVAYATEINGFYCFFLANNQQVAVIF